MNKDSHNILIQTSYNDQGLIYVPIIIHAKNEKRDRVKNPFSPHRKQPFWIPKCEFNLVFYVNRNLRVNPLKFKMPKILTEQVF